MLPYIFKLKSSYYFSSHLHKLVRFHTYTLPLFLATNLELLHWINLGFLNIYKCVQCWHHCWLKKNFSVEETTCIPLFWVEVFLGLSLLMIKLPYGTTLSVQWGNLSSSCSRTSWYLASLLYYDCVDSLQIVSVLIGWGFFSDFLKPEHSLLLVFWICNVSTF